MNISHQNSPVVAAICFNSRIIMNVSDLAGNHTQLKLQRRRMFMFTYKHTYTHMDTKTTFISSTFQDGQHVTGKDSMSRIKGGGGVNAACVSLLLAISKKWKQGGRQGGGFTCGALHVCYMSLLHILQTRQMVEEMHEDGERVEDHVQNFSDHLWVALDVIVQCALPSDVAYIRKPLTGLLSVFQSGRSCCLSVLM